MQGARYIASRRLPLEQTVSNIAFAGLRLSRPWYEPALRFSLHSPRRTILCDDCRSAFAAYPAWVYRVPFWENGGFLSFEATLRCQLQIGPLFAQLSIAST